MIFLLASSKFEGSVPEPQHCLVFEDAPSGVEAGLAAGMCCVMVPDANLDKSLTGKAQKTISSLLDFAPEEWGLPAFQH
eukprot:gene11387-12087_t